MTTVFDLMHALFFYRPIIVVDSRLSYSVADVSLSLSNLCLSESINTQTSGEKEIKSYLRS